MESSKELEELCRVGYSYERGLKGYNIERLIDKHHVLRFHLESSHEYLFALLNHDLPLREELGEPIVNAREELNLLLADGVELLELLDILDLLIVLRSKENFVQRREIILLIAEIRDIHPDRLRFVGPLYGEYTLIIVDQRAFRHNRVTLSQHVNIHVQIVWKEKISLQRDKLR